MTGNETVASELCTLKKELGKSQECQLPRAIWRAKGFNDNPLNTINESIHGEPDHRA